MVLKLSDDLDTNIENEYVETCFKVPVAKTLNSVY